MGRKCLNKLKIKPPEINLGAEADPVRLELTSYVHIKKASTSLV